jgi:very-short-patch-repair endonuclease
MTKAQYNKDLKYFARNLRNDSTKGEVILWSEVLRARKMKGYQFNRQFPMDIGGKGIIVDFICRKLKLIIEVDGYSHNFKYEDDLKRDKVLSELGYKVIRIFEQEVRHDLDNVVRVIENDVGNQEKAMGIT